jgi:hypothetical protein
MRRVIGFLNVGMIGCSVADAFVFEDDASDKFISDTIWEASVDWANSYRDVVSNETEETDDYVEGSDFEREENIDSYWEDYNGENHDMERTGGGSFEEDFERLIK